MQRTSNRTIGLACAGALAVIVGLALAAPLHANAKASRACSDETIECTFAGSLVGMRPGPPSNGALETFTGVLIRTYDGAGSLTQIDNADRRTVAVVPETSPTIPVVESPVSVAAAFQVENRAVTDVPAGNDSHVRFDDARLREIVDRARLSSPTLRNLIARLEESDVVVYVACDRRLRSMKAGELLFVGAAAGIRRVQIRVGYVGTFAGQAALIGHELRHAVEVADARPIVDVRSFDQEYARIGFVDPSTRSKGTHTYETSNAIKAGEQIARELRTRPTVTQVVAAAGH